MDSRKALVSIVAFAMVISFAQIVLGQGTEGKIWLNCDPGERARGIGGWAAGGYICPADYTPGGVYYFDLIVENRGKEDMTDLRIAMAIPRTTTSDDFVSISVDGIVSYLADFSDTEYNPFDEAYGGRHHVYSGDYAIWDIYFHAPDVVPAKATIRIPIVVTLGGDPTIDFMIHFDAFDMFTGYKSPDGHDVTFLSRALLIPREPPVACIEPEEQTVYEGDTVILNATCSYDPDGYIVSWEWDLDVNFDSDGDGTPYNDVDATGPIVSYIWYDDYFSTVKLTVTDNDGLTDVDYAYVTVLNVAPTATFEGAFIEVEIGIRVAGEKWHNVNLTVYKNYNPETGAYEEVLGVIYVERWPGPPDKNPTVGGPSIPVRIDISGNDTYTAVLVYSPYADVDDIVAGDQPINGQLWGANPVWITFTYPDGTKCKNHHCFNVQQSIKRDSDHWNHVEPWIVDIGAIVTTGMPIEFVASATDPGSDDLTFTWDWGDGNITSTTYLYDSIRGPDPPYPPGSPYEPYYGGTVPPLYVTDTQYHAYSAPGTYTVTLTVTDDDGGSSTVIAITITVVSGGPC